MSFCLSRARDRSCAQTASVPAIRAMNIMAERNRQRGIFILCLDYQQRPAWKVWIILEPLHVRATRQGTPRSGGQQTLLPQRQAGRQEGSLGKGRHAGRGEGY